MSNFTERWIKGSDNEVTLLLYNDSTPLAGVWTELRITIGYPTALATLVRLQDGDGITFDGGSVVIQPAQLTPQEQADIGLLPNGKLLRVVIRIQSSTNPNGVHYGEDDSDDRVYLIMRQPP